MNKNIEMVSLPTFSMSSSGQSLITGVELTHEALSRPAEVFFDGRLPFELDSQEYQSGIFRKGTFFQRLMRRFSKE